MKHVTVLAHPFTQSFAAASARGNLMLALLPIVVAAVALITGSALS